MASPRLSTAEPAIHSSLRFLQDALADFHPHDFAVRLWDATTWGPEAGQPARFTLVLNHPGALRALFSAPSELALGEAYVHGVFDVAGDLESAFRLCDYLLGHDWSLARRLRYEKFLASLPSAAPVRDGRHAARLAARPHSKERDREAVTFHYDVSNDFYALWLDRRMLYSCAYFLRPNDDLDAAQEQKLEYICRKLRLRPRERLLDIGCGWGALVMHAARNYGVTALGITLSQPQAELANARITEAGLRGQCRVEVCDYRDLDEPGGYDKLASVGMFEHVGEALLPEYFERAWRLLRPGGIFLNHGITRSASAPARSGPSFIDRYVFPGGEMVPISTALDIAEQVGFEVRDVESLREHYALTLRHWVRRLESRAQEVARYVDEIQYRVWRLFMAGSAYRFHVGRQNVYQALLVKPNHGDSGLPLTRADWYA